LGWFLHQQFGAAANYYACREAGGPLVSAAGAICAVIVVAGGLMSWRAGRGGNLGPRETPGFARLVGIAAAAIFLLAIGFQVLAGALVPPCHR
jgi:hypothetical protein